MKYDIAEDKQGQFIVIVKCGLDILEVHSNARTFTGRDDGNSLEAIMQDVYANALHSQTSGLGVVLDT